MNKRIPGYWTTQKILLNLTGLLVLIPLAPYLNRYIPPLLIGDWNFDLIVALIIAFLIIRLILWAFKPLIVPALAV
jgi:hypothetical protein